jgi:hypothetical protein
MGIGAYYLKFQQKFGKGIRPYYYKEWIGPKILETRPLTGNHNSDIECHVLTWRGDWVNVIWMLKSLYHYGNINYRLCIHEDGTLSKEIINTLRKHFPDSRVIARSEADDKLNSYLKKYPRSKQFRDTNPLALKVYDFNYYLEAERMLLLDSDILFFSRPAEMIRRLEDRHYNKNSLNKDWSDGYSINYESIQPTLNFEFPFLINSGLGLLHKGAIDAALCEEFLHLEGIMSHSHRIEQTLIALCASKYGFEFLPEEYDVHLGQFQPAHCERHFTGPIRHRMYSEGMRELVRIGFLKELK